MAELRVGATARELIPGRPDEIETLAGRMAVLGDGFSAAANQLRAIEAGEWTGQAADAFRSVVGQEPDKYDQAGTAFRVASSASVSFASVLRDAQSRAGQAIDLFESAEAATARWRDAVDRYESAQRRAEASGDDEEMARAAAMSSPGGDPGAGDREAAQSMLAAARAAVTAEGERAAARLEEQWQDAPNEPGLFDKIAGWGGEFVGGVWDSVWGTAEFLWSVSTVRMIIDPEGWARDVTALGQGLWYGITHPVEFGKILLDWDTWAENPARALGRLVPDLLLTLATGGGAAVARGTRAANALRRVAGMADEAGDLATVANRADELGDMARFADRLGPDQLPTDGRLGRLVDGYEPHGDLAPDAFLRRHFDPDARGGQGGWRYPDNDGFDGPRLDHTPQPGDVVDRFGPSSGRYTSPDGTPIEQRALPPDSLNPARPDFDYHRYQVERWDEGAGRVEIGEVAPAFEQPGGGIQHRFERPIQDLIDDGYMTEIPVDSPSFTWPGPVMFEGGVVDRQLEMAGAGQEAR
jgi:hypothetical protein